MFEGKAEHAAYGPVLREPFFTFESAFLFFEFQTIAAPCTRGPGPARCGRGRGRQDVTGAGAGRLWPGPTAADANYPRRTSCSCQGSTQGGIGRMPLSVQLLHSFVQFLHDSFAMDGLPRG